MSEDNGIYTTPGDKTNVDYDVPPNTEQAEAMREGALDGLCDKVLDEIVDLRSFILMQSGGHVRHQLFDLPGRIKDQSLTVAALVHQTEALRLSYANSKNQALELVLCATEDGKAKYSNDKARNLAVQQLLRDDKLYLNNIDELSWKECELRNEEIELEHLQNQFRAYLAVAGMQGVR